MSDHVLPVLYALFVWWFSTGLILWLDGLPRRTFRWSLLGATRALAASASTAWRSAAQDTSVVGAYHRLHLRRCSSGAGTRSAS